MHLNSTRGGNTALSEFNRIHPHFFGFRSLALWLPVFLLFVSGNTAAVLKSPDYLLKGGGPTFILMEEASFVFFDGSGEPVLTIAKIGEVRTSNRRGVIMVRAHSSGIENDTGHTVRWNAEENPFGVELLALGVPADINSDGIVDGLFLTIHWQMVITPSGKGSLTAHFTAEDYLPFE